MSMSPVPERSEISLDPPQRILVTDTVLPAAESSPGSPPTIQDSGDPPSDEMLTAMTEATTPTRRRITWPAGFDRKWQARSLLVLILLVAALLRVVGTRFGFPLLVHPDEWAVVDGVIDMAKRNSFEPPWSYRPDHVEMKTDYILFAGYAAMFKHVAIEVAFARDPIPFYWIARLATAAFGVATVGIAS